MFLSLSLQQHFSGEMTTNNRRVTVESKLTVVSSTPVNPAGMIHKLSALDHAMSHHSVHVIFYFRKNPSGPFDMDRMRASLSEVLSTYPPVTGRLQRDGDGNWVVKCNDAGVRVYRAKVGTTLDEWLRSADADEEKYLTVWEDIPEDPSIWSPFRIQINEFEGGGLAIALSCTHMLADPISATMFFNSWTEIYRDEPLSFPPSFLSSIPRDSLASKIDPNLLAKFKSTMSKSKPPSIKKLTTTTFRFSHSAIEKGLSELHVTNPHATPFDFLTTLFLTCVARLRGDHKRHSLSIFSNYSKFHKKQEQAYFGNGLCYSKWDVDFKEGIRKDDFWPMIDLMESIKKEVGEIGPLYGRELTCVEMDHTIMPRGPGTTDFGRSLMYAAKFEKDESPVHVSYHISGVEGEGLIFVLPSPEEGYGRTVAVTLQEEEMAKLCQDEAILSLNPTMLVSRSA